MKRIIGLALALIMSCCIAISAFAADPVPVNAINLNAEEVIVAVGKSVSIKATIDPTNATNKKLEWSSSDENVAVVKNGKVSGIAVGTTVIAVKAMDNSGIEASATVKVVKPVKKIMTSDAKISLAPGTTWKPTIFVEPSDATIKAINWSSSNNKFANVDENCVISAVAVGKCNIVGKAADGYNAKVQIGIQVKKYDVVIKEFSYSYQNFNVSKLDKIRTLSGQRMVGDWKTKNQCVELKEKTNFTRNDIKIKPLKAGEDTITIEVMPANGKGRKQKAQFTVYVSQSAGNPPYESGMDTVMPFNLLWGSPIEQVKTLESVYRETYDYDVSDITEEDGRIQLSTIKSIKQLFGGTLDEIVFYLSNVTDDGKTIEDANKYKIIGTQYVLKVMDNYVLRDFMSEAKDVLGDYAEMQVDEDTQTRLYKWDLPNVIFTLCQVRNESDNNKILVTVNFEWKGIAAQ